MSLLYVLTGFLRVSRWIGGVRSLLQTLILTTIPLYDGSFLH